MVRKQRECGHGYASHPTRSDVRALRCWRGFSLLELLAVLTIFGLIASVILPRIVDASGRSKQKVRDHHLSTIDEAVERYFIVEGVWPANDLSDIGANPAYFPDGLPTDPVTGNPYRLNASSKRAHVGSP